MRLLFCLTLISALLLGACTKSVPPTKTAIQYADEAEQFLQRGDYAAAVAAWEKVRDNYYSAELSTLAELKIGEAQFLDENYPEATAAYELFLKAHPAHPQTAFVLYRLGLCYYRQMLPADRDQTATRNARITLLNLRKLYPDDPHAAEAADLVKVCNDRLAEQDFLVGHFYLRTDKPQAASLRLEPLLTSAPDFSRRDELYFDLLCAYLELDRKDDAQQIFARLQNEFPASSRIGKARSRLAAE